LSNGVRDILACFLDNIVIQYARNGIYNCIAAGRSNLQLKHALQESAGFEDRVSLDRFVRTLEGCEMSKKWLLAQELHKEEIDNVRLKVKQGKYKNAEKIYVSKPDYPEPKYRENFEGYVVEICRSVRMQMAEEQKTNAEKNKYHNIKVSDFFKKFCSICIHEAILRVGDMLLEVINLKDVKTVNETGMFHALKQLCNATGIDFKPIESDMRERLQKYKDWLKDRRENRRIRQRNKETNRTEESKNEGDNDDIVAKQEEIDAESEESAEEESAEEESAEESSEEGSGEDDQDGTNDGVTAFNVATLSTAVLGTQTGGEFTITYYESMANAVSQTSAVTTSSITPIYVRVGNTLAPNCFDIKPITIIVNKLPEPTPIDGIVCIDSETGTLLNPYTMYSGLTTAGHTFLWKDEAGNTVSTTANYQAVLPGVYTLVATNIATGCASEAISVTVTASEPAVVAYEVSQDFTDNQSKRFFDIFWPMQTIETE
jgi:hypothetical protein